MIEIKTYDGEILATVDANTLVGAELEGVDLRNAQLREADLQGANLEGADLSSALLIGAKLNNAKMMNARLGRADMRGASFEQANLTNANFRRAYCNDVNLVGAQLWNASFEHVNFRGADFHDASLTRADFREGTLANANLSGADLSFVFLGCVQFDNADFTNAKFDRTDFIMCETLGQAKGLSEAQHVGSSSIDAITLRACINTLPYVFLKGVGYNREEIETLQALYGKAFHYYSCFISYTHADDDFASRLHADLQARNVSCWKDNIDLKAGDYWQTQVNEAIRLKDKVVLICSKQSLTRTQIVREIFESIDAQKEQNKKKLFPIMIDDYILTEEFRLLAKEKVATGDWEDNWVPKIKAFHIPDFSKWKDHDQYAKALDKLVTDLKKEVGGK